MKMKALTALWLCFAITFQLKAQNVNIKRENNSQDSIYIEPFAGCKIILIGSDIQQIISKNNLEKWKNKFIQDYKQSAKEKDFPAQAKNIIYLADKDGRRRLKAVPDENVPFDLKTEIKDFKNNFPAYHYTIYDFPISFQYHIYVNDPADLDQLDTINCEKIFMVIAADNKNKKINRFSTIRITRTDTGFIVKNKEWFKTDFLEINFMGGVSLINGSLAPTLSGNIDISTGKKYMRQDFKFGLGYSFYTFGQLENKSFSNIYPISSYDLHFLVNANSGLNKTNKWFGLSVGKFASGPIFGGSVRTGSLDKAWKAGIVSQFGSFGVDYNFIFDKQKNTNTGITFKYYF